MTRSFGRIVAAVAVAAALSGCSQLGGLPQSAPPREVRSGLDLLRAGRDAEAMAQFDAAVRKRPSDLRVYATIAQEAGSRLGRWQIAADYAKRGLKAAPEAAAPERAALHGILGQAHQEMGDFEGAVREHKAALKLMPDNPGLMNNLGYMYAEMPGGEAHLRDALHLTTEAVRIGRQQDVSDAELGVYMDSLGWVQYRLGRYDDALSSLAFAASMAPGEPDIQYHLAMAYRAKGDIASARTMLLRTLRANPRHAPALAALAALPASPPKRGGAASEPRQSPALSAD